MPALPFRFNAAGSCGFLLHAVNMWSGRTAIRSGVFKVRRFGRQKWGGYYA